MDSSSHHWVDISPLKPLSPAHGFVFASNTAAYDTGIVITNTSGDGDPNNPAQSGAVTLYFHKMNGDVVAWTIPAAELPPNGCLQAGQTVTLSLSYIAQHYLSSLEDFYGYITVEANISLDVLDIGAWIYSPDMASIAYVPPFGFESQPQAPVNNAAIVNGINLASGEFICSDMDLHVSSPSGDISIIRTYRSFNINDTYGHNVAADIASGVCSVLGYGWHLNQDKWIPAH